MTGPQQFQAFLGSSSRFWPKLIALVLLTGLPALAQNFECYNYGSYAQCPLPNGSSLTCYNYGGTSSSCQVNHAGGFVSSQTDTSGGGGAGALALLVIWIANKHAEHVTDKAIENASATVILTIKHSIHLMDTSTLVQRLAPYLPPDQKVRIPGHGDQ